MENIGTFSIVGLPFDLRSVPIKINKNGTNAYHNLILPKVMHSNAKIQGQYAGNLDVFELSISNVLYNE